MKTLITLFALLVASTAWTCDKINVKGMTCGSCAKRVEAAFKKHPEVESVQVNVKDGTVQLHYKEGKTLSEEKVKSIIQDAGYELQIKNNT